jgi:hypothetical protein
METVETINLVDEYNKLKTENERLRNVLQSISNNTCCDNCQEAALVARAALKERVMDDTEKLVQMMGRCGLATGHGDTIDDLIFELEKQIRNISNAFSDAQKEIERLRVWNNLVENKWMWIESALQFIAMAKPLDGQTWEKHSKQVKDYAIKALEFKEPE